MVVRDELIRKRVLFIGTSVPLETSEGLEAVQQPLRDRYPIDEQQMQGILSYLTVTQSGLQLEYCDGSKDTILYPITSVSLCAAVRCISVINNATKERIAKFVSLSSVTAGGTNANRPAIFTAITRRTVGKKILECHGFVCESDKDAMDLVQATSTADKISKQKLNGFRTYSSTHSEIHNTNTLKSSVNGNGVDPFPLKVVSGETQPNAAREFYDTPPQHGYFYTSKTSPVKKYTMEKVVSDGEAERLRATSPPPLSARPSIDRRSAYSLNTTRSGPPPPVLHTLPRQPPHMVPVRTIPVHTNVRPRFFSPPPTLLRPRVVSRMKDPYVMGPPPPPFIMDGPPHLIRPRPRRRGSESSASHSHSHDHGSSRSSSPNEITYQKRVNGHHVDGDASSEVSSRPRTPPTDYDKRKPKSRISRREQHDMRHTNYYPTVVRNGDVYPPPPASPPYEFYPGPGGRMPVYYVERARSVPPQIERARTLEKKKVKKGRKDKKSKRKANGVGVPGSDISTDSLMGYMSEQGGSAYAPRDFRRFENQFKHERAFSRSLIEEKRHVPQENQSAYTLNEIMANRGRNGEEFPLY